MMWRRMAGLGVLVVLLMPAALDAQAQKINKLKLEQFFDMEGAGSPQISPDGRQIIYTRTWTDKVNDRRSSSLWIMNADGSRNRFLTDGSGATWSPDGTRIAFLHEGQPRGGQIWVRWMDGEGATTQITRVERRPGNVTWMPDGKSIAFTMQVPRRERWNVRMPARPQGARWTEEPRVVESFVYRADRTGFLDESTRHIFLVPAEGGTERQLTDGPYNYSGSFSITPDGKEIVFSTLREKGWEMEYRNSEVYALNVATGAVRQLTTRKGPDTSPVVSPDGKWVAYLGYDFTDDTYIDNELYIMGIDGSGSRHLTAAFDRSPANLIWAPDSSGVYFAADDSGSRNLHFAPLGGPIRAVTSGVHMLNLSDVNRSGQAVGTLSN
ncbi:MAG TPA: hypothetical protein VGA40_04495, partial [Candidatus Acidoferrales bacterium]